MCLKNSGTLAVASRGRSDSALEPAEFPVDANGNRLNLLGL